MLRGNSPATIDEKGRVKIPTQFRRHIESEFGRDLFVTSLNGESVRIYPLTVWVEIEKKISELPSMNPVVHRFKTYVNYFGQVTTMDRQGRVLIQPHLRKEAEMNGEVAILGNQNFLELWNRKNFETKRREQPLTLEDQNLLSSLGI
ncbi:MAG: division/cell wall cluster transcriptional repressor MraZ [Acidobacteria bacterium]|nr:division/cell wall cluster transcriptional repressor MraZ [Acidobacteriota bacterium]